MDTSNDILRCFVLNIKKYVDLDLLVHSKNLHFHSENKTQFQLMILYISSRVKVKDIDTIELDLNWHDHWHAEHDERFMGYDQYNCRVITYVLIVTSPSYALLSSQLHWYLTPCCFVDAYTYSHLVVLLVISNDILFVKAWIAVIGHVWMQGLETSHRPSL